MKIQDITNFLESIAPIGLQENYDNAGLLTGSAKWDYVRYKRDFLDDSSLVAPYPTIYRTSGKVANITNSTGALVDFILLLEANAALTARYSSFGTFVGVLRCISRRGKNTYVYGLGLRRVDEACPFFEELFAKERYRGLRLLHHDLVEESRSFVSRVNQKRAQNDRRMAFRKPS